MRKTLLLGAATVLAAVLVSGTAARAQAPVAGSFAHLPADTGNAVGGGGSATIIGGGDNLAITYGGAGAGGGGGPGQAGWPARFTGTDGDGLQVAHPAPLPTGPGRDARLVGGGDNLEVVYR